MLVLVLDELRTQQLLKGDDIATEASRSQNRCSRPAMKWRRRSRQVFVQRQQARWQAGGGRDAHSLSSLLWLRDRMLKPELMRVSPATMAKSAPATASTVLRTEQRGGQPSAHTAQG